MRVNLRAGRFRAFLACLLVVGVATPILVAGQSAQQAPTPAQLAALVTAAEGSGLYARSIVEFAASHGLSVSTSEDLLSQGDSLLASATAAQSASNVSAGVQAAQSAMDDYTAAAAESSVAIGSAGLTTSVGYSVVEQAIVEVNATVTTVAAVGAAACAQAGGLGVATLAQSCIEFEATVASARANLTEAAALAVGASGQVNASDQYIDALTLVSATRAAVNSTQSSLLGLASYGYVQRANAYVAAVIDPLAGQVNSTIAAEEAANATYSRFQQSYLAYGLVQSSSVSMVTGSASALAGAISEVNTGGVTTSASTADRVAAEVGSNFSAVLALPGISLLPGVTSAIAACQTDLGAFTQAVNAAASETSAYSLAGFSSFSTYAAAVSQDSSAVDSTGSTFVSCYQTVLAALYPDLGTPGLSVLYDNLASLQVTASVSGVEASLAQATSATARVQADIGTYTTLVATQGPSIVLPSALGSAALAATSGAGAFLNVTGSSAMAQASAAVQEVSQAAESFVVSANSSASATIGTFPSAEGSISAAGVALGALTSGSASSISAAGVYLEASLNSTVAFETDSQAQVAAALRLFAALDIAGGVAAIAQASLDLQAASAV